MEIKCEIFCIWLVLFVVLCDCHQMCMKAPVSEEDKFPACPRSSPDLGDCLLKSLNVLKDRFPDGKLGSDFTIDPLDPFYLKEFDVMSNRVFKWVIYDIYMTGATNFNLESIKTNLNGNYLQVLDRVEIPRINMKSKYKISGPFGIPQITGVLNFSLKNFKVHGDTGVRFFKHGGTEYAKIESVKLVIDNAKLDDVSFSLPIGKVRELGFISKRFVRLFGERMTKIAYRFLESKVDKIHIETVNRFLADVPADVYLSA